MSVVRPSVDPVEIALLLEEAERDARTIPQLSERFPELDLATAYEVQRLVHERRIHAGERMIGFKLGLTSRAKQLAMGVDQPLWGRLTTGLVHPENEPLDSETLIHPRAEPELAFVLGEDVDGAAATVASVLAATRGVLPALEVLDSRYDGFQFTLEDVVADNASAARVVLGGRMIPPTAFDPQLEGMVLRANGAVVQTAAGAAVCGHPAAAVVWLARAAGHLPAGSTILTGGLCAPVELEPGSVVSAEFTTLGTVTLQVV
jgi:2-oxo-3-hexenedioate decarboxylase